MKKFQKAIICLLLLSCNNTPERAAGSDIVIKADDQSSNHTLLINTSDTLISLYYFDKYNDHVIFHLKPKDSISIPVANALVLKQPNFYQCFYLIHTDDTLNVSIDQLGNAILESHHPSDTILNNELDLIRAMFESMPMHSVDFQKVIERAGKTNIKKRDSLFNVDYNRKIAFLETYKVKHSISVDYENIIRDFLKASLFSGSLNNALVNDIKVRTDYEDSLLSLYPEFRRLTGNNHFQIHRLVGPLYIRLLLKHQKNSTTYTDSFYTYCKRDLAGSMREDALFSIVREYCQKNQNTEKWFVKDFINESKDPELSDYIKNIAIRKGLVENLTSSDLLIDQHLTKFAYDSLMDKYKGKVIYVDFWASWCAPCRAEFPFSSKLNDSYSEKGVQFVYLSIDTDLAAWKVANKAELLDRRESSYLFLSPDKSTVSKQLKLKTIPRYILINKKGKIVDMNAPRPSSKDLSKLLEKLLAE